MTLVPFGHNHWCILSLDEREQHFAEAKENGSCEAAT